MTFYQIVEALVISAASLSIIYTAGVVWRVEKKLDVSYKYLLAAIIAFTLAEIVQTTGLGGGKWTAVTVPMLKLIFAGLFLTGVLTMRKLVRIMDGELPENKE